MEDTEKPQPLQNWLAEPERNGIAHAHEALRAGYTRYELRAALFDDDAASSDEDRGLG